jgi:hypothetical protein
MTKVPRGVRPSGPGMPSSTIAFDASSQVLLLHSTPTLFRISLSSRLIVSTTSIPLRSLRTNRIIMSALRNIATLSSRSPIGYAVAQRAGLSTSAVRLAGKESKLRTNSPGISVFRRARGSSPSDANSLCVQTTITVAKKPRGSSRSN